MPLVSEFLNGGLVTARDPALLIEGEVQAADECVYRAHDPGLFRAPGRTQYNSTTIKDSSGATCPVKGMAWAPFPAQLTQQFIALGGNDNSRGTLWTGNFSVIDGTATFTKITGPGQVTDAATTNTSAVITSASGGFANMVLGARISGAGIPTNSVVITLTSATSITISKPATATATITATFDMGIAVAPSDTGVEILDLVQWGGVYYGLFGAGVTQRIYFRSRSIPGTTLDDIVVARPAGMGAVARQPTVSIVSGTWSAVLGNGYYWFLTTEVTNPDQPDEVEGTYAPKDDKGVQIGPVVGNVTDYTTQCVRVARPSIVNDGSDGRLATHWRIYMSPKQTDASTTPSLATFRLVATIPITDTSKDLTDTNSSRTGFPTVKSAVSGRDEWTLPSNLLNAYDNIAAFGNSGAGVNASMNKLTTFTMSGSDGDFTGKTVTGIQVSVRAKLGPATGAGNYFLYLRNTGITKDSGPILGEVRTFDWKINVVGSQFDTLGVAWVAADFTSAGTGGFEVWIEKAGSNSNQHIAVDGVQVTVFFSGTSVNLNGKPFRIVTYRDQIGNTLDIPARGTPPLSSTGDLFQGSMVVNDLSNENVIVWSLPGEPEAFPGVVDKGKPGPYVMAFNERRHNKVNFIRRCGQVLIVGMNDAVKRVNYLPAETDTDFREGLAHEDLASDHGIVGPLAGALFTVPGGGGQQLAYVAQNGLHVTDGVTTRFLNLDLKWSTLVDSANISKCILRNYPKEQWLVLYYAPYGGNGKNSRAMVFNYSQDKIKEGGMIPAIGPISVAARSAMVATLNGQHVLFTGYHTGGLIYTEDNGFTIPAGYKSDDSTTVIGAPRAVSRRFFPNGIDRSAREERIYIHFSATGSLVVTTNCTFTKGSPTVTMASTTGLVKGMLVRSTNVVGDTIILSVDSATQITISTNAFEAGTFSTGFDSSTLSVTVRRQNIGEAATACETVYSSMRVGSLLVVHPDNQGQALELQFDKVLMPDASRVDAGVDMRLNFFAYDMADAGKEQNRS